MTRAGRATDIPEIEAMLREMHRASKYAGRVDISDKVMRFTLEAAVAGQNQNGPQATMVRIAEQKGAPVGFMIGTLARIYHIGDKLVAQDLWLYVRKGASAGNVLTLIDDYTAWWQANPKVIEGVLSWNDALPGASRVAKIYERKGYARNGELFEMVRGAE